MDRLGNSDRPVLGNILYSFMKAGSLTFIHRQADFCLTGNYRRSAADECLNSALLL